MTSNDREEHKKNINTKKILQWKDQWLLIKENIEKYTFKKKKGTTGKNTKMLTLKKTSMKRSSIIDGYWWKRRLKNIYFWRMYIFLKDMPIEI